MTVLVWMRSLAWGFAGRLAHRAASGNSNPLSGATSRCNLTIMVGRKHSLAASPWHEQISCITYLRMILAYVQGVKR